MKQIFLIIFCASLVITVSHGQGSCYNHKCQCVDLPDKKLSEINPGCNATDNSRKPQCVSAMHRYCNKIWFPWYQPDYPLTAASHASYYGMIYFDCIKSSYARYASLTELQLYNSNCTHNDSQSISCLTAIHRFCAANGNGGNAGLAQEVPADSIYVTCFKSSLKKSVNITELQEKHSPCTVSKASGHDCFIAARRWCGYAGYNGGVIQEAGNNTLLVACYKRLYYNSVTV